MEILYTEFNFKTSKDVEIMDTVPFAYLCKACLSRSWFLQNSR